jgi:hypothetical protein
MSIIDGVRDLAGMPRGSREENSYPTCIIIALHAGTGQLSAAILRSFTNTLSTACDSRVSKLNSCHLQMFSLALLGLY